MLARINRFQEQIARLRDILSSKGVIRGSGNGFDTLIAGSVPWNSTKNAGTPFDKTSETITRINQMLEFIQELEKKWGGFQTEAISTQVID